MVTYSDFVLIPCDACAGTGEPEHPASTEHAYCAECEGTGLIRAAVESLDVELRAGFSLGAIFALGMLTSTEIAIARAEGWL